MLFLFNTEIFELDDPRETALETETPIQPATLMGLSVARAIKLLRETIFEIPDIVNEKPDRARFLAALIAWKTGEANALLAVRPTAARGAHDVHVRLASISLVTLAQLSELKKGGNLTPRAINDAVWTQAPQRMPAE